MYPKNLGCPLNKEWLNNKLVVLDINSAAGIPFSGNDEIPSIF